MWGGKFTRSRLITVFMLGVWGGLGGCSFVSLTSGARSVSVASSKADILLKQCKFIGNTTVSLWAKAGIFQSDQNIEEQLNTLARNEAVTMGGDTVIADTPIDNAQRGFRIYKCNSTSQ